MNKKRAKRKLRTIQMESEKFTPDDVDANESASSTSGVNFKKILISIVEKSTNQKNNIYSNNDNYLKSFMTFYQNHKHTDTERINSKLISPKYKISSYSSSLSSSSSSVLSSEPVYGLDSLESTTSSYISFTSNLPPVSSLSSSHYDDYHNQHKTNEFYSIFVSVITAAVFLFFIMWRWFKMNSDFRKALREQFEIQQHVRNNSTNNNNNTNSTNATSQAVRQPICSAGSTRMALLPVNRWTYTNSFMLPSTREELQATASNLITQLSNGEYRSAQQHQLMIDRARYCLQQLKLHARLTQFQRQQQQQRRSNYSTFNSTSHRSNLISDYSTSSSISPLSLSEHSSTNSLCHPDTSLPPVPPVSITSLQTLTSTFHAAESHFTANMHANRARNSSVYNFNNLNSTNNNNTNSSNNQQKLINCNEPPPDYESLMIKSCSLPSYSNLKTSNNNSSTEKSNEKSQEK